MTISIYESHEPWAMVTSVSFISLCFSIATVAARGIAITTLAPQVTKKKSDFAQKEALQISVQSKSPYSYVIMQHSASANKEPALN